jgi:hypothetical protein
MTKYNPVHFFLSPRYCQFTEKCNQSGGSNAEQFRTEFAELSRLITIHYRLFIHRTHRPLTIPRPPKKTDELPLTVTPAPQIMLRFICSSLTAIVSRTVNCNNHSNVLWIRSIHWNRNDSVPETSFNGTDMSCIKTVKWGKCSHSQETIFPRADTNTIWAQTAGFLEYRRQTDIPCLESFNFLTTARQSAVCKLQLKVLLKREIWD